MKWIALALFLVGAAVAVGAIWLDERQRFSDGGFVAWLAVLLTGVAACGAGVVWLLVLGFEAIP